MPYTIGEVARMMNIAPSTLRYFGMSEEQSYRCHPWGTADKKK